jgi:hypothetical protein
MHRILVGTLAAVAFAAAPLAAQGISIGPMAGVSFTSISVDVEELDLDTDGNTGFAIGAFVEFELGNTFAIEPQLLYVGKGGAASDATADLGLDLHYLQIPVLLKAEFGRGRGGLVPSIFAGPQFGFRVSCEQTVDLGFGEVATDCDDDTIKGTDYGVVAGIGLDFGNFSLQGRYEWGLQNLSEASDLGDIDVKNRGFLFTLGYGFRLN